MAVTIYALSLQKSTQSSSMASHWFYTLILGFFMISPSKSLTCTSQRFTNNKLFDHCDDLPVLRSYLHWDYDSSNSTISIAFIAPPSRPDGWISWAINPTGAGMAGSQALVAFKDTADGLMKVKTFNISSYTSIVPGNLSIDVKDMSAEFSDGLMKIFATVALPEKGKTTVTQVWQVGPAVSDGFPARHEFQPANLNSVSTLDVLSGQSNTAGGGDSRTKKRNIHGILNAVSWGVMFPIGILIARYVRSFNPQGSVWFYLHVSCQMSSYVLGVAGWGTGLKLGSQSKGISYSSHRNIGIALFSLATLQIFALFLRPKQDHKFRFYWNIYHHGAGYTILILGIINVFKGLDILDPSKKWKTIYTVVIASLGVIAILLEAITWIVVLKKKNSTKPYDGSNNSNARQQTLAP